MSSTELSRRSLLAGAVTGVAAAVLPAGAEGVKAVRKGRIHQAVCRGPYAHIPLDELCRAAAEMGLQGIDLLRPEEWDVPLRYGLRCTMGQAVSLDLYHGLAHPDQQARLEQDLRTAIPLAAKHKVPNLICFSGTRFHVLDDQGAANCIASFNRLKPIAEDHGVTLCMELLNSKINHPGYMCDHTAWGVNVVRAVNSPRVKLLYDIYHMQIMEGDLIRTITTNKEWIAHFHTGGVPGRHELDGTQEVRWDGVMRAIAEMGFTGYVAHEFSPTRDPLTSLRQAVELCDV